LGANVEQALEKQGAMLGTIPNTTTQHHVR